MSEDCEYVLEPLREGESARWLAIVESRIWSTPLLENPDVRDVLHLFAKANDSHSTHFHV
jgi:hypothetical protein